MEKREDSKVVAGWVNGKARETEARGATGGTQCDLHEWWGDKANMRERVNDWAMHIFREHTKEADAWAEQ